MSGYDFIVVANRLPVDATRLDDGTTIYSPSPGGLVTALKPVLKQSGGIWVGWDGGWGSNPKPFDSDGMHLHPVGLGEDDYENFYEGFSNATLWPLYHDRIVEPFFHRSWWESYRRVNHRFAAEAATVAANGATVWVQDYQLQLVPGMLKTMRPDLTIGFFCHIPFPAPQLFRQLPWRDDIIAGLEGADLLGFQQLDSARNFLALTGSPADTGTPSVRDVTARTAVHKKAVAAFPISADTAAICRMADQARADGSVARIRESLGNPDTMFLGVDRLDYTKGILERLHALEELFESGRLDAATVRFVQLATPSRERINHYQVTKSKVEEAIGRINGRFSSVGHPVIDYHLQAMPYSKLMGFYAAADVMVVTPFKDGMNLVAKEYVAAHSDGSGALVLSEFAGAAAELSEAFLINPFDRASLTNQIAAACTAITCDKAAAAQRMRMLHEEVMAYDVARWANSFLKHLVTNKENQS